MSFRYFFCSLFVLFAAGPMAAEDSISWFSGFGQISLGNFAAQADVKTAASSAVLIMTGDCVISADHTITARLSGPGSDSLFTEYKLEFDGTGSGSTGAATVDFTTYDQFLASPVRITHALNDDNVTLTLSVRAKNHPNNVANAGEYSAAQTLTVSWAGL